MNSPTRTIATGHHPRARNDRTWVRRMVERAALLIIHVTTIGALLVPTHGLAQSLPRFLTHASTQLECQDTPFGTRVTLGREAEYVDMTVTDDGSRELHFFQFGHKSGASVPGISLDMLTHGIGSDDLFDIIGADLNGDGRDEAIVASRAIGGGVRLDVWGHDNMDDGVDEAEFIDVWQWPAFGVQDVQLLAGDFNGSADGRQELAALVTFTGSIALYVLEGANSGGIVQANGETAGVWLAPQNVAEISVATGDVLLDGHDQIVIGYVDYPDVDSTDLHYQLLEYATDIPLLLPVAQGNVGIGSMGFVDHIGDGILYDNGSQDTPNDLDRLDLGIGNLVDSAAAELVSFIAYRMGSEFRIAMRLQHFRSTRDANNRITNIELAIRDQQRPFDSTVLAGEWQTGSVSYEGKIANVEFSVSESLGRAEIVLVDAPAEEQAIELAAFKVHVDLVAGYQWESNGMLARFTNTSTGDVEQYQWNFGDGTAIVEVENPSHLYAEVGEHTVTLTINGVNGESRTYESLVTVGEGAQAGGYTPPYLYLIDPDPAYLGSHPVDGTPRYLNVAVDDLDANATAEVITLASIDGSNLLRSVWSIDGGAFIGDHQLDMRDGYGQLALAELDALDFDGDTLQATAALDCRRVEEPQLRQVIWLPPYFERLQANASKLATFGRSVTGGSETEHRAGSYTSHDVSGYIGTTVGTPSGSVEVSARATAGYRYQASEGAIHGNSQELTVSQGYSQNDGEALVVLEENQFDCYSYNVTTQTTGEVPQSGVRMCAKIEDSEHDMGTDAVTWDTTIPAYADHPPVQWVPLHRDWTSIALFQPVVSNTEFMPNQGPDKATDGRFSTEARSAGTSNIPYLEVDLGSVRDISNIRVFPTAGHSAALAGARVVTSISPLHGLPWGQDVHVYQPMTEDNAMFDRWNVWTRDPEHPEQMLKARYIRVLQPDTASLRIAEIQAFGPVHVDPPRYPDAVCDRNLSDGFFMARIWDPEDAIFRTVEVHGDLLWDGTWDGWTSPWQNTGICTNDGNLLSASIWTDVTVGGSASVDWSLGNANTDLVGTTTSFDSAIHVGAEFDIKAGFIASVTAGGSYEFATGLTRETQTSSYWTTGLETGGAISGFATQFGRLIDDCGYNPRPYAYHLTERSITGYQHDIYVVDYIVHESPATWQRSNISILCSRADPIFASGFD